MAGCCNIVAPSHPSVTFGDSSPQGEPLITVGASIARPDNPAPPPNSPGGYRIRPYVPKNRRKLRCRGAQCAPVQLNDSARFHGRTLFAPTATARLRVGGGVLDAPSNARALRADIESAPTPTKRFGPGGVKRREVKKREEKRSTPAFFSFFTSRPPLWGS